MSGDQSVVLDSGSAALLIWDTGEGGLDAGPWDGNSLVRITEDAAEEGVFIDTGDQYGPFSVTTRQLNTEPPVGAEWEDVVEFSVTTGRSLEISEPEDRYPSVTLVDGAGTYRIRVSARGRARRHGAEEDDPDSLDDANEEPLEWYLIEAWPASASPGKIIRLISAHAENELAGPPSPPDIPEAEAGMAAAARIGRDVDQSPGARSLSGATGSLTVERTLAGSRRRWFRSFTYHINWSHLWTRGGSWGFSGKDTHDYQIGPFRLASGDGHPDQLSGSRGAVRVALVEVNRPAHVVRTWNWVIQNWDADRRWQQWPGVLSTDSRVTTRLVETKDDQGRPWTTVTVEHGGLPVEWLDDMTAWWNFQLAIAQTTLLGQSSRGASSEHVQSETP